MNKFKENDIIKHKITKIIYLVVKVMPYNYKLKAINIKNVTIFRQYKIALADKTFDLLEI